MLAIIANCHPYIEQCTDGKSIDKFLANFKLEKVNKIVLKVELEKDRRKTETLTEITDIERVRWLISLLNKVSCVEESSLYDNPYELWLYENDKLRLKITLFTSYKRVRVKFYNPEKIPVVDYKLGSEVFVIKDEILCSWYNELIKNYFPPTEEVARD